MSILWLDQPECRDFMLVGGKVANLSRLAASYPVPAGFCLTADSFAGAIHGRLSLEEIRVEVGVAYKKLGQHCGQSEPAVAVRSSATDEDGSAASFAGQFETFLNVVGLEAVLQAVNRCWTAASSERVLAYRRQQGVNQVGNRLAVLIQQFIPSDVAGVAFSVNPVTGHRNEVIINASWGLGESVVSGRVTPDTYAVRQTDLAVLSRNIADKQRLTLPGSDGTREVAVPRILRQQPSLSNEQIREVTYLVLALQAEMGWPVDVEYAYYNDRLYLLQCRPITGVPSH